MPPRSRRPRVAGLRRPGGQADAESTEPTTPETSTGRTATLAEERADAPAAGQLAEEPDVDRDPPQDRPVDHPGVTAGETAGEAAKPTAGETAGATAESAAGERAAAFSDDQLGEKPDVDHGSPDDRPVDHPGTGAAARPEDAPTERVDLAKETTTDARPMPTGRSGRPRGPSRRRPAPSTGAASTGSTGSTGTLVEDRPAEAPDRAGDATGEPGRLRRAGRAAGDPLRRLGRSRRALVTVLAVVIVVCLVLAGLAFWRGAVARSSGPVANGAVVDAAATAELVGQTRQAVEQVFSYDFAKLDDSLNAARTLGTGDFPAQYQQIFDQAIRGPATAQRLRQTATVLNIGVQSIDGDQASVMALVQFHAERASTGQSTDAPGLLSLRMQREDGVWKLAQLRPLAPGQ